MSDAPVAPGGPEHASPVSPDDASSPAQPPRRGRRWLKLLVALVLILLGLVLLLPTLVSSGPGTNLVLSVVDRALPGSVKISDLSIGWLGGAHVLGVDLLDPAGQSVIHLDTLDAPGLSLLGVLRNSGDLGQIDLQGLRGRIVQDASGSTNLDKALGLGQSPSQAAPPSSQEPSDLPHVRLTVKDAELSFEAPNMPPAQVKNLDLDFNAHDAAQIKADLSADLTYDQQTGKINVQGTIDDARDAQGRLTLGAAKPRLTAELADVPVGALDQIASGGGKLLALLGPVLRGRVDVTGTIHDLQAVVEAHSENLQAQVSARMTPEAIEAGKDSNVSLNVAPQAWAKLTVDPHTGQPVAELLKPVKLTLTIDQGRIPRDARGVLAEQANLRATLAMSDAVLRWADARLGETSISGMSMAAEADGATKALYAVLAAKTQQSGQAGQLDVRARMAPAGGGDVTAAADRWSVNADIAAKGLPVVLADQLAKLSNLLPDLLGASADVTCQVSGDLQRMADQSFQPAKMQLRASLATPRLPEPWVISANTDGKTFTLDPGPIGSIVLSQELLTSLSSRFPALAAYVPLVDTKQPPRLRLSVQKLQAPIQTFTPDVLEAGLTLSLDRLSLHGDPKLNGISLSDVTLTARTDPASQTLASELTAQLGYAGQSAKITSQSTAMLDKLPAIMGAQSKVRVESLPVALIDQLAGSAGATPSRPGRYVSLIGPTVDRLEWTTQYLSPDSGAETQMMLQAPRLSALASAQWLPGRSVQLIGSDNRVVLKLTPESFAAWLASAGGTSDAASAWQLVDPVDVALTIPQARIGFKPSADPAQTGGVDLSTAKVNLQAAVPTLSLRRADGTPLALQGLGVAVTTEDPRKLIHLNLQGQVVGVDAAAGTRTSNPLRSDTQLTGLIDTRGNLDLAHAVIVTDTAVEQLPTSLLVGTLGLSPTYVQTLGPWVSLTAKGRYPGDVDVLLRSPNVDAPLAMTIDADRTLRL
ncbi:MAG: hypothetical protein IT441_07630, partial [Phycisphaeraceae bacterium]|nr:hypothetical protein [Phycisphaeraceae bacterium]